MICHITTYIHNYTWFQGCKVCESPQHTDIKLETADKVTDVSHTNQDSQSLKGPATQKRHSSLNQVSLLPWCFQEAECKISAQTDSKIYNEPAGSATCIQCHVSKRKRQEKIKHRLSDKRHEPWNRMESRAAVTVQWDQTESHTTDQGDWQLDDKQSQVGQEHSPPTSDQDVAGLQPLCSAGGGGGNRAACVVFTSSPPWATPAPAHLN